MSNISFVKISVNWSRFFARTLSRLNDPNSLSQVFSRSQLDVSAWLVSNLDFNLYGSFGSLPNCLRKDSWMKWELLGMLIGTWSIDSKTHVSKCEWKECAKTSIRKPAPSEIISDSTRQWQTAVYHVHTHEIGETNKLMWSQYIQYTSERWFRVSQLTCKWSILKKHKLQPWISFPTWKNCKLSWVWLIWLSNSPIFYRNACFTLLLTLPQYVLFTGNLVGQFLPSTNIWELFEHIQRRAAFMTGKVGCNWMQVSSFLSVSSLKDGWNCFFDDGERYENCEDWSGHNAPFFQACDGDGLCDLCDSCSRKSCGQCENGCLVLALQCHEKRRMCRQHGRLDRRGDRARRGGHVECESWWKLRMTVRSLSKICSHTWWRKKEASYVRHLHRDLGSDKINSTMCYSAQHDTFSADDGDKHGSSRDFSSRTSACRPRDTDPWGDHDVSSGAQFGAHRGPDSWSSCAADRDRESSMK